MAIQRQPDISLVFLPCLIGAGSVEVESVLLNIQHEETGETGDAPPYLHFSLPAPS